MISVALYHEIIVSIARCVNVLGLLVILWGVIMIMKDFLLELLEDDPKSKRQLRQKLGSYLVLALEFFIAADIIRTVVSPNWNEIAMLAAIIGLRTVLSVFLGLELKESNGNGKKK